MRLFGSLGRKMFAAVAAVLLVAGGSFAFFAYRTGSETLAGYGRDKAYALATYGRGVVELLMLNGEKDHLRSALRSVDSAGTLAALFLLRPDGGVSMSTLAGAPGGMPPIGAFTDDADYPGAKFLSATERGQTFQYVVTPMQRKPECSGCHAGNEPVLGHLAVKVPMDRIEEASMKHRATNILMTVLTFGGVGAVMSAALLYLVVRPVRRLGTTMRTLRRDLDRVERGQEPHFAPLPATTRNDEIADLIEAFNALVGRLNEAHAGLNELHRKQLDQADRLATAGEMAAGMAHEIRNPLAGVLGALQVIDGEMAGGDRNKPIVREMIVQLERMNLAVSDLLSYARPTPPRLESTDVNSILDRTMAILDPQIRSRRIEAERTLDREIPSISADRKLVQQLFWNVILNAIQAMEEGGRLLVSTARSERAVTVTVRDTGRGISERDRENIFRPFFTTKHQGTGLGLTVSRRIVEAHGGTIGLENGTGGGTVCTIRLPYGFTGGMA